MSNHIGNGIALSISSAIFLSIELIIFKHLSKKNKGKMDDVALLWFFRFGSMLFISLYLLYEIWIKGEKPLVNINVDTELGWIVILSLVSALAIIMFFKSIQYFNNIGIPKAIRSISIPLTFIFSIIIIDKMKWKGISPWVWVGMGLLTCGVGCLIYGEITDSNKII